MTLFQLVKAVLDVLYKESQDIYNEKTDSIIKSKIKYLSDSYINLGNTQFTPIDYRDPTTRFAYVYKYVASHGDYLVQLMEQLRTTTESNIFKNRSALVSCLGGGPGSDIIAILKYLSNFTSEPVEEVTFYLLDKQQAWADTWTELNKVFGGKIVHTYFQPFDITSPSSWEFQKKFTQADVFTLSYFVSEVKNLDSTGAIKQSFDTIFGSAKSGSIILYVDNGHQSFNDYFDSICEESKFETLICESNIRKTPSFTEQSNALLEYTAKFDQSPKIQSYLSFRALRKK